FCSMGTFAYAQGATTQTLSGSVVDASGAVIPGADITAKHTGTGIAYNAVSNGEGLFSLPSLPVGTYSVTVTLQGFKTVIIKDVALSSAAPANVKATMEVGGVSEQVTVASTSEIVQTQRDGLRQLPAGRDDRERQSPGVDQRPAARHDQHHPRRRQHPGQHAQDD